MAQRTPQPIFTELFAYDPGEPSQLLGKWRISSQLDSKLQPLRVGVVEDAIGKPVTPVNWKQGEDVIIVPSVSDERAKEEFPDGWKAPKPYLRIVRQPQ
jgi:hypothetical protein